MNDPQFTSAVRGLLMAIGSILVTRGVIKDSSLIEPIVGGVLAIISLVWSQWYHYTNKAGLLLAGLTIVALTGCASIETTAYRTLATTESTVDATMNGWGDYVRAGMATEKDEATVKGIYVRYQAAVKVAKAAVNSYYATKADPSQMNQTLAMVDSVASELLNFIKPLIAKGKI